MMLPSSISKDPFGGTFLFPVMYYTRELLQKKTGGCMGFLRNTTRPVKIMVGMGIGIVIGILCNLFLNPETVQDFFLVRLFEIGGNLFLNLFYQVFIKNPAP